MIALALLACAARSGPAELDLSAPALALAADPPVLATRDRVATIGAEATLHRAGGRLWAVVGEIGDRELLALDDALTIRWRKPLQADEYWRVSADGARVVLADFLGCIVLVDGTTGARVHGFTWTINPWAWDVSPGGGEVWTLHEDGLVGWRFGAEGERLATFALTEAESGALEISPDGTFAWITGDGVLTARSLADGTELGRATLVDHQICEVDGARVWVEPRWDERAPFPLDARTLARAGAADASRCQGQGTATRRLMWRMYGLAVEDASGWKASLGYHIDDALLDTDGGGWWEVRGGEASHWAFRAAASVLLPDDPIGPADPESVTWADGHVEITTGSAIGTPTRFPTPKFDSAALAPGRLVTTDAGIVRVYALPEGTLVAVHRVLHPLAEDHPVWVSSLVVRDGRIRALLTGGGRGRIVEIPLD